MQEFPSEFRRIVVSVPPWIINGDFNSVCATASVRDATEYKRRFRRMADYLATGEFREDASIPTWMLLTREGDDPYKGILVQSAVSKCRMEYGVM